MLINFISDKKISVLLNADMENKGFEQTSSNVLSVSLTNSPRLKGYNLLSILAPNQTFIFRFLSEHCLPSTLRLYV